VEGLGFNYDGNDLDVRVRVGWVCGLNRLYFLYEALIITGTSNPHKERTIFSKWWWTAISREDR
jgi:hypothetical protein